MKQIISRPPLKRALRKITREEKAQILTLIEDITKERQMS
jgi:hypothetical protein